VGVSGRMNSTSPPDCHRGLPSSHIERTCDHIDDLFARMRVLGAPPGSELDEHLDDFASATLRSFRWRSVRWMPGPCAGARPLPTITPLRR
jgi:hypothetical protein